jgi:hypothetical protein
MKIGTFVFGAPAGPGPVAIPYAGITQGIAGPPLTAPSAPPRSVQLTLETATPANARIGPGSLIGGFPGTFTCDLSAAVVPGDVLHVVIYL